MSTGRTNFFKTLTYTTRVYSLEIAPCASNVQSLFFSFSLNIQLLLCIIIFLKDYLLWVLQHPDMFLVCFCSTLYRLIFFLQCLFILFLGIWFTWCLKIFSGNGSRLCVMLCNIASHILLCNICYAASHILLCNIASHSDVNKSLCPTAHYEIPQRWFRDFGNVVCSWWHVARTATSH